MKAVAPRFSVTQDGTTLNVYHADRGQGLPRHEHIYAHLTVCHAGSCIVRKEGRELVMTKNTQPVNLVGNEWHEIEALGHDYICSVNRFWKVDPIWRYRKAPQAAFLYGLSHLYQFKNKIKSSLSFPASGR